MEEHKPHSDGNESELNERGNGRPEASEAPGRPTESARGWLRIQLAVLGFVGFCGVMWADGTSSAPQWAAGVAATLVVSSFVLALVAIFLVGTVAHVLPGSDEDEADAVQRAPGRLRAGVTLTYVALAAVVAATLTAWWPAAEDGRAVEVRGSGASVCGELLDGPDGAVRLDTTDGVVDVPLTAIASVAPVADC